MQDFLWGVGTSAYEIEGAFDVGKKGRSVLDNLAHSVSLIKDGTNGDQGADFFHSFHEDILLLKELGVNSFRFSLSWPRIITDGKSEVSQFGLNFYSQVIDELIANGIEPIICIYDWDMPAVLAIEGGLLSPEMPKWFAFYTETVVKAFGDRVKKWITFRDPEIAIGGGIYKGLFIPWLKLKTPLLSLALKNFFYLHAAASKIIKDNCKDGLVGIGSYAEGILPNTKKKEDVKKLQEIYFAQNQDNILTTPPLFMDAIFLKEVNKQYRSLLQIENVKDERAFLKKINSVTDFIALDIFSSYVNNGQPPNPNLTFSSDLQAANSLYWVCKFFYQRYNVPLLINGTGINTFQEGVHDKTRIEYLKRCLTSLDKLKQEKVQLIGFCHWSFLDGFEMQDGYSAQYGLVSVDRKTMAREKKDSFNFYKEAISQEEKHNG
ncbi:MAG: family 1 glycosylhydrolase [Bacilli bacterium]|jgi:beta-glucosidase|nr:family 1 glycosylhydrolase [Bacilli bacterium]